MANLDDARTHAEAALSAITDCCGADDRECVLYLMEATRALLAASAPAAWAREEKGPRCPFCDTARIERDARLDLWVCHVCKRSWAVAEEPAPPPPPAQGAVREAAESDTKQKEESHG